MKIVNLDDMTKVKYLREQAKGTKHVTFDPSGRYISVSCTDGLVYIYTLLSEEPELVRKLDGVIQRLEAEDEATSRVVWHPDGTAFASAEATRDISIFSTGEWKKEKVFSGGHNGSITAISWSPNGALLATAGADGQVLLWETKTQKVVKSYDFANVINLAWHPTTNALSFTTSDGELFIYDGIVPREYQPLLQKPLQAGQRTGQRWPPAAYCADGQHNRERLDKLDERGKECGENRRPCVCPIHNGLLRAVCHVYPVLMDIGRTT